MPCHAKPSLAALAPVLFNLLGATMQLRFIDLVQLAETIEGAELAARVDGPGGERVHLLRYGGQDMIAIQHHGDTATVVEADDDGLPSIHSAAAAALGGGPRGD